MSDLRKLREERLMTQAELATASGVGLATINRMEKGKVTPSFRTIRAVAHALDVDPASLRQTTATRQGSLL